MGRYQGESPFQSQGLVWSGGTGYLLAPDGVRQFFDKPTFSFQFDGLYCEPTLCHRTEGATETPLTTGQITEVNDWITAQIALPKIVNGVNAEGVYLQSVPENQVVRIVSNPPPVYGSWRFDFDLSDQHGGDHWREAYCVNAQGEYVGNVDNPFAVVSSEPPPVQYGEIWRWNFVLGDWLDTRSAPEILTARQKAKIADAWFTAAMHLETGSIDVTTSAGTHSYGTDQGTQDNIMKALSGVLANITPNPRYWTPKGSLAPISITHDDVKLIAAALGAAYDAHVQAYLVHKAQIMALTTPAQVDAYNVLTGWPS